MATDLPRTTASPINAVRFSGPAASASEQVRRWIESPVEFWEACAREHGTVALLELGSLGPVALLSDPEHVRQLFALPAERFEVRQYNEHYRHVMGDSGVLLLDGEPHQRQRRILAPSFRPDQLLPAASVIRDVVDASVAGWPVDAPFNPRRDLHDVTFRVVLHLLFGTVDSPTASR
jgi:cytochrome P450 family 110